MNQCRRLPITPLRRGAARFRQSVAQVHTVVLIRHGESVWNLENRFTGWCDVPLTASGEGDAKDAGKLIGERGLKFDVAFTSNLERAWRTCAMVLADSGQASVQTFRSWQLNERHYGALQGHFKNNQRLIDIFGETKVHELRRSYSAIPPSLYDINFLKLMGPQALDVCTGTMNPGYVDFEKYHRVKEQLQKLSKTSLDSPASSYSPPASCPAEFFRFPATESLKQCQERAYGYWEKVIAPRVRNGERVLIVAHANTIRALVKVIDSIDEELIPHLKIPNGVPLVYTLDEDLQPTDLTDDIGFQANYLVSARNHSKTMAYERCVRKKLRSLFEFLDHDGDGRITHECLLRGLNHLTSAQFAAAAAAATAADATADAEGGTVRGSVNKSREDEYEVEELLRCIPNADEQGGVSLQAFLDAEATLLPKLTRLHLLQ